MPKTKTTDAEPPEPNLIWLGKGEPPHTITAGMSKAITIDVPEAEQRAGFYHPRAGEILQQRRPDYKEYHGRSRPEAVIGIGSDRAEQTPADVLPKVEKGGE